MLIVCPGCKTRFSFTEHNVRALKIKLCCSKCKAIFRVLRKTPSPVAEPLPEVPQPAQFTRIKVVVANESPAFCEAVIKVLAGEPFDVFTFNDGREALAAITRLKPALVLLDVALPSMYGFEVCEAIRKDPAIAYVKVILIASIYDKTRYKRAPLSLYGADDYIEKHHIPDTLAVMIYRLLSGQKPLEAPPEARTVAEEEAQGVPQELSQSEMIAQEISRRELQQDEESKTSLPAPTAPELPEAHAKAKRLARIIISDIVLYNQAMVDEGVRNDNLSELLADDITEGKALYARRVAEEIRTSSSYLEDAFEELVATKKKELGL